ncbi:geobacillin-26 family protein [Bacillus sp. RO1]|uniref:geobacillin-26 family protein n=1 Tax=Bacillus sp. RO1 TaxID=2722703 RepID=UPI001456DDCB|nr:geobacillin-26 family protein [Bacillus sp. RO1]NLP52076.1 geobacillin-26 family protein [Bacillus sp. RO1]
MFKICFKSTLLSIAAVLVFSLIGPNASNAMNSGSNIALSTQDFKSTVGLDPIEDKETIDIIQGIETKIIKDNKNFRVVETIENGVVSIGTFDKKRNIITTEIKGDKSSKVEIDLNELEALASELNDTTAEGGFVTLASTLQENTFSNMEYTITYSSPQKWQLRRPQPGSLYKTYYKNVTRTSSNSKNLDNFKKEVDLLNDYEIKFIGAAVGSGIAWLAALVIASLSGGAGVAVGLAAAGVTGAAYNYAIAVERHAKNALHYYWSV